MDRNGTLSKIPQTGERLSLVFAGLLVLIIGVLAFNSGTAFRRSARQAALTRECVDTVNALLSSLKDAETGQRGFLLTGEDRYLEPYQRKLSEIPAELDRLARLGSQDPAGQSARVDRLKPLVKDKLDELAQTIDLRRRQGLDAALAIVRTDRGRAIMDQIRGLCAEVQAATYDLSSRQTQEARTRANETALTAVLGSAAIFAFLVFATVSVERGTRRRQELIAALQAGEDEVRRSRDWLQTTLASIGDAVIATDDRGLVTVLNGVAESLTGWTNREAAGKPLEQVFVIRNEETGHEVENPVSKVLREGRIVGLANHTELIARDGRPVPIDDSAAPIQDGGKVTGVVLVFRDITARREIEKRVAEQTDNLRRKAHLLESVPCFAFDLEGRITYWNPGAAELYGFSQDEALQQVSHSLLQTEFPVPLNEIRAQVKTAGVWEGELVHTRRDGARVTVASHWALHRDGEGRLAEIVESNVDITWRREAEEALRTSNAELVRANEDLNEFAFAASHDLQEPLRMITSYSQLLLKGYRGQLDDEAAACVEFITDGTRRMRDLLRDLLAYIQLAGEEQKLVNPVDLNRVFERAVGNCQSAIEEAQASVTSDPLPTVSGHEPQFVQLFQNLISNGLKYRAGRRPRIHVFAEMQAGHWRIAVKDNGIGIAPEYHQHIFGVFKRLHGKTIPGTGIGLAICQRVVDRAGGRIWVESETGQGATFYISLLAAMKRAAAYEG